jgi:hypothetical protein
MKYIKPYKIFESASPNFPTTRDEVIEVCEKYEIYNYIINDDLSINVEGDVDLNIDIDEDIGLQNIKLKYLPVVFNYVKGSFYCQDNELISLEGSPRDVGIFDCSKNKLKTLEGGPVDVRGFFSCDDNNLKTLNGSPSNVSRWFSCSNNNLKTLEGSPNVVNGEFVCHNNELESLKGITKNITDRLYINHNNIKSLDYFPTTTSIIFTQGNPIDVLISTFIRNDNFNDLLEEFEEFEILRNGVVVYLDRLKTFIEGFDLKMPSLDRIKQEYKIIE